jgi:hypothetical protein
MHFFKSRCSEKAGTWFMDQNPHLSLCKENIPKQYGGYSSLKKGTVS